MRTLKAPLCRSVKKIYRQPMDPLYKGSWLPNGQTEGLKRIFPYGKIERRQALRRIYGQLCLKKRVIGPRQARPDPAEAPEDRNGRQTASHPG